MFPQSLRLAVTTTISALLFAASFAAAQDHELALKITRPSSQEEKEHIRITGIAEMDRDTVFDRLHPGLTIVSQEKNVSRHRINGLRVTTFGASRASASPPMLLTFGTGGGDINEAEPNDQVAQAVSLPVNVFGEIGFDRDVDFFAFQALAGQRITIEPFAARLRNSELVADIALFDSSGALLDTVVGSVNNDPLIRFVALQDQVLIVGIADVDDLGGASFDYLLNITRGNDLDEQEPNHRSAQPMPDLPQTIFGEITVRDDVDFYSFTASAGQTLIVDVDAEVLGSRLDAEINLIDPASGAEYFYNDQHDGDDPRYNIVLPYSGRYVIGVGSFNGNSRGFYRLNASLVSSAGAPTVISVTRLAKKLIEVSGSGFTAGSVVEVNGVARGTTFVDSNTLRAKVKSRAGNVVTVANPPDDRRSNPIVVQ
jgi:pre-peptidase